MAQRQPADGAAVDDAGKVPRKPTEGGGNGSGGGGDLHPLIQGILMTLPKPGAQWPAQDRMNWLTMASSIFKIIYPDSNGGEISIELKKNQGGATSAP